MRSAFLRLGVVLLLVTPGFAQMRSTISAGPVRGAHPGGIISRPEFGRHFHRGNRFGMVVYPFGFYDGYYGYDEPYSEVVEQPAPVVVVRDERPALPPVGRAQNGESGQLRAC